MAGETLTIGQAAAAAGVTRKAVRVYEAKGLLPPAGRSPAGYRLYTPEDVELLTFIRRARTLGLRLDDIGEVLAVHRGGRPVCDAVRAFLDGRLEEIDAALSDLRALRRTLAETRGAADDCSAGDATVCAIIEEQPVGGRP